MSHWELAALHRPPILSEKMRENREQREMRGMEGNKV